MSILNFGSLNLDYTYRVPHIAAPGETLTSRSQEVRPGGKGLNQSVALARAGAVVCHAGLIGEDGRILEEICRESGVDTQFIGVSDVRTGNAIIQVDDSGQNCIILFPGANRAVDEQFADRVLESFGSEDHILLQNEISSLPYIIDRAWERGMKIILNPSPMDERLKECDLEKVWLFILNEVEGAQLTGMKEPEGILQEMRRRYPGARIVLTLGADGSMYSGEGKVLRQEIFPTETVDTTGAGDTFSGYFITEYLASGDAASALRRASMASAIAVSRRGAAEAVPEMEEVIKVLRERGSL
ncbi:MAG TPA: ribokinase [Candidatus Mediterraneibacter norfolkensis]|nr:ribokinase [Candidatus Mediterraneibacter norfolkensis]